MNIVIYDLEIKNSVGQGHPIGWNDKDKMGISVAVTFDYLSGEYKIWMDDNLEEFIDMLASSDMVVGFNSINFDNPVVTAEAGVQGIELPDDFCASLNALSYDICKESLAANGYKRSPGGFKMEDHLSALYGMGKTEDGADAPKFYQAGKLGKVITYCMADVHRTRLLFEHIWYQGTLKCTKKPKAFKVKRPQEYLGLDIATRLPFTLFPTTDKAFESILGAKSVI